MILQGINRQGPFGEAYVGLVVQAAGFVLAKFSQDSGHKVDWMIAGAGADNTTRDPRLEVQVKTTSDKPLESGECAYDVDRALHDWARKPKELLDVPRVIVLVRVPSSPEAWMAQADDQLVTRHCAYWISLRDAAELPDGQGTRSVRFPIAQRFDVPGLTRVMSDIRGGNWP